MGFADATSLPCFLTARYSGPKDKDVQAPPSPVPNFRSGLNREAFTTTPWRILVVSGGSNREIVQSAMSRWALQPVCCSSVNEARSLMRGSNPSLIFCDEKLDDGSYRDLLRDFTAPRKPCFVVMASSPDVDQTFKEAVSLGAFDLIADPCRRSDVQWIAVRAIQEEAKRSGSRRRSIVFGPQDPTPHMEGEPGHEPSGEPQ